MPFRRWNGTSDNLRVSPGAVVGNGAMTLYAYCNPTVIAEPNIITLHNEAGNGQYDLWIFGGFLSFYNGTTVVKSAIEVGAADGPAFYAWTKTSGTTKPIFYRYKGGVLTKKEGPEAVPNGGAITGGTIRFGIFNAAEFYKGDMFAAGAVNAALSEAEIEAIAKAAYLYHWRALSTPSGLWFFDQSSVEIPVVDATGNGANQTAISGTTVINEEPAIPYKLVLTLSKIEGTGAFSLALKAKQILALSTIEGTGSVSLTLKAKALLSLSTVVSQGGLSLTLRTGKALTLSKIAGTGSMSLAVGKQIKTVPFIREYAPVELGLRVTAPDGTPYRWARDEPLAENVLANIELSDESPGGCKTAQGSLARNPQLHFPDIIPYSEIDFYQAGGESVWKGYLDKGPKDSGQQMAISPTMLGWQALLEDNNALYIGIIDRDVAKWGDPSNQQILNFAYLLSQDGVTVYNGWQDAGQAAPGIIFQYDHLGKGNPGGEQWYYGEGCSIHDMYVDFYGPGLNELWLTKFGLANNDLGAGFDESADYNGAAGPFLNQRVQASGSNRKYARIQNWFALGEAAEITPWLGNNQWLNPCIVGDIGGVATLLGTWPLVGFSPQQIIQYIISTYGSPLYTTSESVEDDRFIVPQGWYPATTLAAIVKDVVKYSLFDWFLFSKLFEYRQQGTYGRFWKAYVGSSNLNEVGIDSTRLWSSIVVAYEDMSGITRTVGPPGSGANVETSALEITDPNHPAVLAKRTRRDKLDLKGKGTPETAIAVGQRFLEEANLLSRSGSATLGGYILDNMGVLWPAARVKSGDWISFVDASDRSYRKIVNKNYNDNNRSSEIDVDAPPEGLEALLERLQVGLIELGVS